MKWQLKSTFYAHELVVIIMIFFSSFPFEMITRDELFLLVTSNYGAYFYQHRSL